jgi:dihydrofolate synthase/folylpolyglutamate synthase
MINPKKFEIPSKATYKLDGMRLAAALLDHPERHRKTILVAGTNGKGSTCTYLTALFQASGLKIGTYSSPHVVSRTERIRINSKPISEVELKKYEKKYERVLAPLTYFERFTILAFLIFKNKNVDLQILEVGLGGRLDATNISDPDFSAIATIDYDHQDVLGEKLSQIAREKAGIMRAHRACFISPQKKEAAEALKISAALGDSKILWSAKQKFSKGIEAALRSVQKLRGDHQETNARLALSVFQEAAFDWNLEFDAKEIIKAIGTPLWPGRLQVVRRKPLFLVDGAHNENAVEILCDWLNKNAKAKRFHLVFGLMQDKPAQKVIRALKPYAREVILPSEFYPERQMPAHQLAKLWGATSSKVTPDLTETLKQLWKKRQPTLVVGSFYLAGAALRDLKKLKYIK